MKKMNLKFIESIWKFLTKNFFRKSSLSLFGIGLIFLLILSLIIVSERYYVQPSDATEKTNFIAMVGSVLGGGALLLGIYFTWKQLQVTLDGQITDRFSKAIEYIDSGNNISIKLGGLYSLERVAIDSRRDLPEIIEILCAYLRVNSRSEVINRPIHTVVTNRELADDELNEILKTKFNRPILEEDIQIALQILGKIARLYEMSGDNPLVVSRNLFGIDIRGARLPENTNLSCFFIDNSQLDYVIIPADSKLIGARICNTDMRGAIMDAVDLSNSKLIGSAMECMEFRRATLNKTQFSTSRLACAIFIEVNAGEANFNQAKLKKASFSRAILRKADFRNADLREVSLDEADLREVAFGSANLSQANFRDAQLDGANLHKANLKDAQELTDKQLAKAMLCQTILPDGTVSNRDCEKLGISSKNHID